MSNPNNYNIPFKTSKEIRSGFLEFFKKKGHLIVPSATIAPNDDPTLLFSNSGMNQFKAIFLGDNRLGYKRVADTQKCLRVSGKHNDLEEVGRDGRHHTFFEMLGNWSFGDYYKKEAISWAWELITEVFKMPKDRLFATVYMEDDEAFEMWKTLTDIEEKRILRFTKDNFWEMGPIGPCGPCAEIHFDTGDINTQEATFRDKIEGVNGENDRYIEFWNLVFMQHERLQDGSLRPLKATHVDTGAGLERFCAIIQNKATNYETDLFMPILEKIATLSKVPYISGEKGTPHRVIADHLRALSFAIGDGVTPGNEGRGYVMRRILRRASRFAHGLGHKEPFIYKLVPTLVEIMKETFPEISERQDYIAQVIESEEERFLRTLGLGLSRMEKVISELKQKNKKEISGEEVFLFHDTYGFPSDLTRVIAEEHGFSIDEKGYETSMHEQRERGRKATKFDATLASDEGWTIYNPKKETAFSGYTTCEEASVKTHRFQEVGDFIYVVLDKSPFYAEAGGQVGDQGTLKNDGVELKIEDTFKLYEMHIHKCVLLSGLITKQTMQQFSAKVDQGLREQTKRNHSATHLLHAALKKVLGDGVNQQGSHVGPERLRLDFSHPKGLTHAEVAQVENLVNAEILNNYAIGTAVLPIDEAKKSGAVALFGEKYGDKVRVLTMGSFSKELCGGTHAQATGDIGFFKIIHETSIASGVRRIEGVTGLGAVHYFQEQSKVLHELQNLLKATPDKLTHKVTELQAEMKHLHHDLEKIIHGQLEDYAVQLLKDRRELSEGKFAITAKLDPKKVKKDHLQALMDALQSKIPTGVAVLTYVENEELALLVCVGDKALGQWKANDLVKKLGTIVDAKGGGRPEKARAGSKQWQKEEALLAEAKKVLV